MNEPTESTEPIEPTNRREPSVMYPTDCVIYYTDDAEYQHSLVLVFGEDLCHFDPVSEAIFESTKGNEEFMKLYETAAIQLLSMDPHDGLIILFSFHYFGAFHSLVCDYLRDRTIDAKVYNELLDALKRQIRS